MSRTITAMFNDRSEAEAAAAQLRTQFGTEPRIIDKSSSSSGSSSSSSSSSESGGFWSDLKEMFVADDDRPSYEEGVRRGHFMLCANVPEDQADRACTMIEQAGAIDFDETENQWRSEGWEGRDTTQSFRRNEDSRGGRTDTMSEGSNIVEEERIPLVEEQLRVGKREEQRGGARVRSYVEERPVSESVNLREEHVNVTRRPVDEPISGDIDNDMLRERSVEMRETAERPVVDKQARVTEEVVVQKTAEQRTEQVEDTVRQTKVDVDEDPRGAFGFEQDRDTSTVREFDTDKSGRR